MQRHFRRYGFYYALLGAVGLMSTLLWLYLRHVHTKIASPADRGLFGDSFGGATAMVSAFSLVALIIAIALQRREMQQAADAANEQIHQAESQLEHSKDQLALSQNQLELTRDYESLRLRPFIKSEWHPLDGAPYKYELRIRNVGLGPAIISDIAFPTDYNRPAPDDKEDEVQWKAALRFALKKGGSRLIVDQVVIDNISHGNRALAPNEYQRFLRFSLSALSPPPDVTAHEALQANALPVVHFFAMTGQKYNSVSQFDFTTTLTERSYSAPRPAQPREHVHTVSTSGSATATPVQPEYKYGLPMTMDQKRLIYISVAISVVVLLAYCFRFTLLGRGISSDPSDWGTFGDYIGGIAGTLFSFAAFIAILLTLHFQRHQATLQEVQKLLSSIAATIDEALRHPFPLQVKLSEAAPPMTVSVSDFMSVEASYELLREANPDLPRHEPARFSDFQVLSVLRPVVSELTQLAGTLIEYRKLGGMPFVAFYYKQRFTTIVAYFSLLHVTDSPIIHKAFDTEGALKALRERRADFQQSAHSGDPDCAER